MGKLVINTEMATGMIVAGGAGVGAVEGYGGNGASAARQYGYQDETNHGARYRRTGHSNRPTQDRALETCLFWL